VHIVLYAAAPTVMTERPWWNSTNLEILNQGSNPTFCSGRKLDVTDITLGSFGLLGSFKSWEVSSEPSLSDHRHILFTIQDCVPEHLIHWRTQRGGVWGFNGGRPPPGRALLFNSRSAGKGSGGGSPLVRGSAKFANG
jgi:hypothetical protein